MHPFPLLIALGWIAFWAYWIVSATRTKQNARSLSMKRFFGMRIGIIFVAALAMLAFDQLPQSFRDHSLCSSAVMRALGFIVFLVGATLAVQARISLGRNWGMPMSKKKEPELVTAGPYRYIRHPIYSGILTMAVGSAIDVNSYWIPVFVVSAIYFCYSAVIEERIMSKQFGATYAQYKRKSKMFIPFIF